MFSHDKGCTRCSSAPPLWTLDFISYSVGLQVHTSLVHSVFCAKLYSQGSAAVNITLPERLSYCSSHTYHCGDHRACQSFTAQACSALWTGTGVVRAASGSMLTGGYTGGGHRCFTETSCKSFGTAAPVEAHAHSPILTRRLTLNRLYLTACSLPSTNTCAFVDVHTSPPILT